MADQPVDTVAPAAEPTPTLPESPNRNPELKESGLPPPQPLFPTPPPNQGQNPSTPPPPNLLFPPPSIHPYPAAPSFRLATPSLPQFAPLPVPSNPNLPQPPSYSTSGGLPPPGVNAVPTTPLGAAGQVPVQSSMPLSMPPPYAPLRPPYAQLPNGYPAIPPGMARFPPQYAPLLRPPYPRPGVVFMPPFSRPPVPMVRPAIPILTPMVRPLPVVTIPEKLQITVYIGKISPTVENDFMLSLLQLCGPVKSWKRPQDPTNGTLKSFGLYEFESPEGVLRALRLLSKLSIDGQELMVNVNQAARDYLKLFIAKKLESYKTLKEADAESTKKDDEDASGDKKNGTANSSTESPNPPTDTTVRDDSSTAKSESSDVDFGLVTDEDRQADQEALEKIKGMIEERVKNKPLPPPPALTTSVGSTNPQMDVPAKSKDGEVDIDVNKDSAEDKNDNEMITDSKPAGDQDRSELSSPDRDRKHDKRRDRERDVKREKERELERYEREREQDRAKREKDREYRIREDERRYKAREKEWEVREKEKEHLRKREKEREKDRAHERKLEVVAQERESQDGYSKKRKYKSSDDERRKRQREKEEDMADRLKEEEEIVEAKRMAEEEELQKRQEEEEELKHLSEHPVDEIEVAVLSSDLTNTTNKDIPEMGVSNHVGDETMQNGVGDESSVASLPNAEARHNANAASRKLGFGLHGLGKRTSVPSVFNQDEDEDAHKEKKMRPLVPIDYTTEEHFQASASEAPPSSNIAAAAEFAKHISGAVPKEEKYDTEKERNKRSNDRHGQRDKDRNTNESSRSRDEIKKENHTRDRDRGYGLDKAKTPDNQKLLGAKQLIDMIPKTKDELFSYEINWETYDRNSLQERMKPWISKKITEFLGEEEPTLVEYIVSSTREHVKASEMLDRLQGILDEEAEMFVLKMWRMLIFEIKRVETGLALRSR